MPSFNIVRESSPGESFRVASIRGTYDLPPGDVREEFHGSIPIDQLEWNVGLIVGRSGTGKTTIARELFREAYFYAPLYGAHTVLDDFAADLSVKEITQTLNAVGFSSPPSWLKPYDVLSSGEQMRVDLAMALLSSSGLIVFDEFTSVVDRDVAKIGSMAVSKSVRRAKRQFVAVTCHFDVREYLEPDWVFSTDSMTFDTDKKKDQQLLSTFGKKKVGGRLFASITI